MSVFSEELRRTYCGNSHACTPSTGCACDKLDEAADRIETLEAENEKAFQMLSVFAFDPMLEGRAIQGRAREWLNHHSTLTREVQK